MAHMRDEWGIFERDEPYQVHVVPIDDAQEHELKDGCHCLPLVRQPEFSRPIYVHHAFDGRVTEDAEVLM